MTSEPFADDDAFLPIDYTERRCDNCGAVYEPKYGHCCLSREPGPNRSDGSRLWTVAAAVVGFAISGVVVWVLWRWL